MKIDPEEIVAQWDLFSTSEKENASLVSSFVGQYFSDVGTDLDNYTLPDLSTELPWVVKNKSYESWARDLNAMWGDLGRITSPSVLANPQRYSLLQRKNPFIIPGGRFREGYYWDSYWIVTGLISTGMLTTAKGMILNLLDDVNKFGFVPNGGRIYYLNRSQPPLLSEMVMAWVSAAKIEISNDIVDEFLAYAVPTLDKEYAFWMRPGEHAVTMPDGLSTLNRYYTNSTAPRPESYREDLATASASCASASGGSAQEGGEGVEVPSPSAAADAYANLAAAAETGWDFSSRWIGMPASTSTTTSLPPFSLSCISTRSVIPVDLNSILYKMEKNLAFLHEEVTSKQQTSKSINAKSYLAFASARAKAMSTWLWQENKATWKDLWLQPSHASTSAFIERPDVAASSAASELLALWSGVLEDEGSSSSRSGIDGRSNDRQQQLKRRIFENFMKSGLLQAWGIQTTTVPNSETGQQWDAPNAWSPLQHFALEALRSLGLPEATALGDDIANRWLESNYMGWVNAAQMYEKYNALAMGERGEGGEYPPQAGFGWTNGYVLYLLHQSAISII